MKYPKEIYIRPSFIKSRSDVVEKKEFCSFGYDLYRPCLIHEKNDSYCKFNGKNINIGNCFSQYGKKRLLGDDNKESKKHRNNFKIGNTNRTINEKKNIKKHKSVFFGNEKLVYPTNKNSYGNLPFNYNKNKYYKYKKIETKNINNKNRSLSDLISSGFKNHNYNYNIDLNKRREKTIGGGILDDSYSGNFLKNRK
jgi:hypothetical protein